jgi:hypothetical protein
VSDIHGVDEALAILSPHWDEIEAWLHDQNARFIELMASDHDALGRVLKAHLVIETFMTEFLEDRLGAEEVRDAGLSFHKKASLLPNAGSPASFVKPGILTVNRIRNRFSHDPKATLSDVDLGPIADALMVMRPDVKFSDPIQQIEEFAAAACAFLIVSPSSIRGKIEEAFAHFRAAPNE